MEKDLARFMSYVEIKPDGCWWWIGGRDIKDYGIFWYKGKTQFAHRISLLLHNKLKEFNPGKVIRHSCRNTSCVNHHHLNEGTREENALDKVRDGTDLRGERCHFAKLNWNSVSDIRRKSMEGVKNKTLSLEYNISSSCISSIIRNKTWVL